MQRQDRRGRARGPRSDRASRATAQDPRGRPAPRAPLRHVVRHLPRRDGHDARRRRNARQGRPHQDDGDRRRVRDHRDGRLLALPSRGRPSRTGRGRLLRCVDQVGARHQGGRHDHPRSRQRGHRSARGLRRGQADGLLRCLPERLGAVSGAPGRARQAQAERRGALLRARDLGRARLRFPLRLPRSPPHGDRPGAPRTRIRHRPGHHGSDRRVSRDQERRLGHRGRESLSPPRPGAHRSHRGALLRDRHPRPRRVRRRGHQTLSVATRRAEGHPVRLHRARHRHLPPATRGGALRLLRQAQVGHQGLRVDGLRAGRLS